MGVDPNFTEVPKPPVEEDSEESKEPKGSKAKD